jgi:uncharacterized DUF497 family protein
MPTRDIEPRPIGNYEFEWSARKAAGNARKHGIRFKEAEIAFNDDFGMIFDDEWHSDNEPREILIGYSNRNRLLVVSFIQRGDNRIRIVSARKADGKEQQFYEETPRH